MRHILRIPFRLAVCLCAALGCMHVQAAAAQDGSSGGSVIGVVTASNAKGDTIPVANALVQLWGTDATTAALRDSACAAWLADKSVWTQAKEEVESPSGMDLTGTPVGRDVFILSSLMKLQRDSIRSGPDGSFAFHNVPVGPYTVDAEVYANNTFLQWSRDAAVMPRAVGHVSLDPASVSENQYCAVIATAADTAKVYDVTELDSPLHQLGARRPELPRVRQGKETISFIVDQTGVPEPNSIVVSGASEPAALADARKTVSALRFAPPLLHGRPVRAREMIIIQSLQ